MSEENFSLNELDVARERYLSEQAEEIPLPQIKFRYAKALLKSQDADTKTRGIRLMQDLLQQGFMQNECLYGIAHALFILGDHQRSRKYCERLLRLDPAHADGRALFKCAGGTDTSSEIDVMGVGSMVLAFALIVVTVAFQIYKHH